VGLSLLHQKGLARTQVLPRGGDELAHLVHVDIILLQELADGREGAEDLGHMVLHQPRPTTYDVRGHVHVVLADAVLQDLLKGVGERGVPDIVKQRRHEQGPSLVVGELEGLAH